MCLNLQRMIAEQLIRAQQAFHHKSTGTDRRLTETKLPPINIVDSSRAQHKNSVKTKTLLTLYYRPMKIRPLFLTTKQKPQPCVGHKQIT